MPLLVLACTSFIFIFPANVCLESFHCLFSLGRWLTYRAVQGVYYTVSLQRLTRTGLQKARRGDAFTAGSISQCRIGIAGQSKAYIIQGQFSNIRPSDHQWTHMVSSWVLGQTWFYWRSEGSVSSDLERFIQVINCVLFPFTGGCCSYFWGWRMIN